MARFHVPQPHGFASRLSPGLALVVTPPRGNDRAAQQREIDLRVQLEPCGGRLYLWDLRHETSLSG